MKLVFSTPHRLLFASSLALAGSACGDGRQPAPSYAQDVLPIVSVKCAPCHTGVGFGGSNHGNTYADTQKDSYVCVGEKIFTCMLARIEDGSMPWNAGCTGDPMRDSTNGACLSALEQQVIRDWVNGGAAP